MGNEQSGVTSSGQDLLNGTSSTSSVSSMTEDLRRRLNRGTRYNMKILVRGDRNTGKTSLWSRLQGRPFSPSYTPTDRIGVCTIDWSYKSSSDVVKVEVWDVVDRGIRKKRRNGGLKIENDEVDEVESESIEDTAREGMKGSFELGVADATTVDVMRGATSVVFVFDVTKRWTWEYVLREVPGALKALPCGAHVLVVGNFRDMGERRVVSEREARESCACSEWEGRVCYVEASMKNGFGLRGVATWFSLPFLALQRQTLLAEVKRNEGDTETAVEELRLLGEEVTYDGFLKALSEKKAAAKIEAASAPPPPLEKQPSRGQLRTSPPPPAPPVASAASPVAQDSHSSPREIAPDAVQQQQQGGAAGGGGVATSNAAAPQSWKTLWKSMTQSKSQLTTEQAKAAPVVPAKGKETPPTPQAAAPVVVEHPQQQSVVGGAKSKKPKPTLSKDEDEGTASTIEELRKLAEQAQQAKSVAAASRSLPPPSLSGGVEDFKPGGDLDDSFFGKTADDGWLDTKAPGTSTLEDHNDDDDDDDDDSKGNPMLQQDVDL